MNTGATKSFLTEEAAGGAPAEHREAEANAAKLQLPAHTLPSCPGRRQTDFWEECLPLEVVLGHQVGSKETILSALST